MEKELVKSKGIRWIRYNEFDHTLDVAYTRSGEYRYFGVKPDVYAWLTKVQSKGRFIARLVKDKYQYQRLDAELTLSQEGNLEHQLRDSLKSPPTKEN